MPHAKGAEDAKVEGRRLRSGFTTDGAGAGRKAQGAKRRARGTGRGARGAGREAQGARREAEEFRHPMHAVWFSDGFSYG